MNVADERRKTLNFLSQSGLWEFAMRQAEAVLAMPYETKVPNESGLIEGARVKENDQDIGSIFRGGNGEKLHSPARKNTPLRPENLGRAARAVIAARKAVPGGPDLVGPNTDLPNRSKRTEHRREKLLDVSEILFARWGYTGVSVRDVTDLAEMRLASVTYYFGSKQNLYLEVLRRRAKPLSEARMAAMELAIGRDLQGTEFIRELVKAYMMPALNFSVNGGEGWRNFFQLIGHVTFSKIWPPMINSYFNGPAQMFIRALRDRFPHVTDMQAQAVSLLIIGPVIYVLARTGRIETFDNPAFTSDSLDILAPITLDFVTGGVCNALGIHA